MAAICIAGESGTGKSTSVGQIPELGIKGLDPKETVYINVANKDLPFRGWKNKYTGEVSKGGNYLATSNSNVIAQAITYISQKRDDIKNIVIDDFQYTMAFEFMNRAKEKGYDKFTDLGVNASSVLTAAKNSSKNVFFLWHPELDEKTEFKLKTAGKMVDTYFNPQGLFTIVLYTFTEKEGDSITYKFVTNKDGMYPAKSPVGMFDKYIPNDLGYVVDKIDEYNNA
jgi:hypothetical protein